MDENDILIIQKLKDEYKKINHGIYSSNPFTVGLFDDANYYQWRVTTIGPKDTSYKGGIFTIKLTFPKDYPSSPPELRFLTPIYHLNVNSFKGPNLGIVRIDLIENWKPSITVRDILLNLYSTIFYLTDTNFSLDEDKKIEFIRHKDLYESKIKFFTKKYASPFSQYYKSFLDSWCFSCYDYIFNPINFRSEDK